jgi:hypothetical protein
MNDDVFIGREVERAKRLLEFVKGEVQEMYVGARFLFAAEMMKYLTPEITELQKGQ